MSVPHDDFNHAKVGRGGPPRPDFPGPPYRNSLGQHAADPEVIA